MAKRERVGSGFQWREEREWGLMGHQESFDKFPLHDVELHDFLHVCLGGDAIPDAFGIDHHARSLRTIVQTAGFVGADDPFQVQSFRLLLETGMQRFRAELGTAAPRVIGFPFVGTDENVSLVTRHARCPRHADFDVGGYAPA